MVTNNHLPSLQGKVNFSGTVVGKLQQFYGSFDQSPSRKARTFRCEWERKNSAFSNVTARKEIGGGSWCTEEHKRGLSLICW